jgi:hypothetical protein
MCDCDEMEFEDFEIRLTAMSQKLPEATTEAPLLVPVLRVSAPKKSK